MQQTAYYTNNFPGVKNPPELHRGSAPMPLGGSGAERKGEEGTKQGRKGKEGGAQTGWRGRRV